MFIDDKINNWTIIDGPSLKHHTLGFTCRCVCGTIRWVNKSHLLNNRSKSCGCITRKDLTGQKFGKLLVIKYSHTQERGNKNYKRTDRYWLCKCECGNETYKRSGDLKNDKISSCGCYLKRKLKFGLSSKKNLYAIYKKQCAAKRGLEFNIEFDDFIRITSSNCYYCGEQPSTIIKSPRGNGDYYYNGLDRVNNQQGYIISNVVPCCKTCNSAKGIMTQSEFSSWVQRIYNFLKKENFHGH